MSEQQHSPQRAEIEALLNRDPVLLQYADLFEQHSIRADVFSDLTAADLEEIGVSPMGHRIKIMRLVAKYNRILARKSHQHSAQPGTDSGATADADGLISNARERLVDVHELAVAYSDSGSGSGSDFDGPERDAGDEAATLTPAQVSAALHARENEFDEPEPTPVESIGALARRCETFEAQIKKLSDQVLRFRTDILRFTKESEPLPNPLGNPVGNMVGNTPPAASDSRRPSDGGYFVPHVNTTSTTNAYTPSAPEVSSPLSASSSISTLRLSAPQSLHTRPPPVGMARINISAANGGGSSPDQASPNTASSTRHGVSSSSGSGSSSKVNSASSTHPHSSYLPTSFEGNTSAPASGLPPSKHQSRADEPPPQIVRMSSAPEILSTRHSTLKKMPSSGFTSKPFEQLKRKGSRIDLSTGVDPLPHSLRCSEGDNTIEVLSSMAKLYKLEGDLRQWRLQLIYGENVRDLLDHEHPLLIYRQMKEAGYLGLTFQARKVSRPKPPSDGNFI